MSDKNGFLILNSEICTAVSEAAYAASFSLCMWIYSATVPNARTPLKMLAMVNVLLAAPSRGLNCRAIIAGWPASNNQEAANREYASLLSRHGWKTAHAASTPIMHPKAWIFDEDGAIVGSHNSTVAGLTMSRNISLFTRELAVIEQIKREFETAWHSINRIQA